MHCPLHAALVDDPQPALKTKRASQLCLPWTSGQVERMIRLLKEATVHRYHYDSHEQLRDHLAAFLEAYDSPSD